MPLKQSLVQNNVASLVDRVSRFNGLLKNANTRMKPVKHCAACDCFVLEARMLRDAICREGHRS